MTITKRVVPIITVNDIEKERRRYLEVLGLAEVMNHGWIVTLADATGTHQISLMTKDLTAPVNPQASIQIQDVDAARARGLETIHELRDEPWDVRRFFFRDASGNIINVLAHLD